jgi:hypothetical protein
MFLCQSRRLFSLTPTDRAAVLNFFSAICFSVIRHCSDDYGGKLRFEGFRHRISPEVSQTWRLPFLQKTLLRSLEAVSQNSGPLSGPRDLANG